MSIYCSRPIDYISMVGIQVRSTFNYPIEDMYEQ
jgi:hypothetical protein